MDTGKYYLYLDECGDPNLIGYDKEFPIFTLCGILMSESQKAAVELQVRQIKESFFGRSDLILHSRDIRKRQNGFGTLSDNATRQAFYESIDQLMSQRLYTIVSASILKDEYTRRYGKLTDVYALALSFVMERTVFLLDSLTQGHASLKTTIEGRGKREDNALRVSYQRVLAAGTYWADSHRMLNYFGALAVRQKKENIAGLQIADLAAYPIARHLLNPDAPSPAFDIMKANIYTDSQTGKVYGMTAYPR